ncbi:autotransporter-associated beta strand repeat-containing protein [Microvirga rosea]|uniref:autotransporter-associated beta strand repeat-containing protein n=1 Tax=Microvirga rosea TaxID=2715425 RepID=UPI001D0B8392|nr:autotransporter-associated beta strand repeat-containing protein [Microvirga rosea]MCB8819954.1 autotransporter-associated beta strand repeat-containing protein [Microvirga rosea]
MLAPISASYGFLIRTYTVNSLFLPGGSLLDPDARYIFRDGGLIMTGSAPRIVYGSSPSPQVSTAEFSGSMTLELQSTTTFNGTAGTASFWAPSPISGAGGLTKSGLGRLVLAGPNIYTGGTRIEGGTLQVDGAGTLTLSGDNTPSGTTTINSGTIQVGDGGSTGTLDSGNVINNATLVFNRSNDQTVSNVISGTR